MIKICKNCLTINTIKFNPIINGLCQACVNYQTQNQIKWSSRLRNLKKIFKGKNNSFDCIVPVSGGKDSSFQVIKLREYGANPLALCVDTGHFSEIGKYNLNNLRNNGFDILHYKIPQDVANILSKIGLIEDGDIGWSESILINSITTNLAVKLGINKIFWGENSALEYGGPKKVAQSKYLDVKTYKIYSSKNNFKMQKLLNKYGLKRKSLYFSFPSINYLNKLQPFYLGYFVKWDGFQNFEYVKKFGFKSFHKRVSGTVLNYEHIDNYHDGIHDYFRFLKFGIGRSYDQVSRMLRRNMIPINEAKKLINKFNGEFPQNYLGNKLEDILDEIKISKNQFRKLEHKYHNKKIVHKVKGRYKLRFTF